MSDVRNLATSFVLGKASHARTMLEQCSNTTQNWLSAEINNELSGDDVKQSFLISDESSAKR